MHTVSPALDTAINKQTVRTRPVMVAEWSNNRYAPDISVVNNFGGDSDKSDDRWPLESIISPRYTHSGIPRAVVGQARAHGKYHDSKFRVVSENDVYKYWISPTTSGSGGAMNSVDVRVDYGGAISANKIIAVFEVSANAPASVDLYVEVGGSWQSVVSGATPNSDGVIEYWFDNPGWSQAQDHGHGSVFSDYHNSGVEIEITGARMVVNSMDAANKYCHIIELDTRFDYDMTELVESAHGTRSMEEQDVVMPFGHMATDNVTFTLDNTDDLFSPENTGSPFYGKLGQNIKMRYGHEFYTNNEEWEFIEHGVMWSNSWGVNTDSPVVTVDASDKSKFMQTEKLPNMMIKPSNILPKAPVFGDVSDGSRFVSPGRIRDIMESGFVGFVTRDEKDLSPPWTYRVKDVVREILQRTGFDVEIFNTNNINKGIPNVWYAGDEITVWEALRDVARASAGAYWYDDHGRFTWTDGDFLYDNTPELVVDHDESLVSLSHEFDVTANKATIFYNVYGPETGDFGEPVKSTLWTPDSTTGLMATALGEDISETDDELTLGVTSANDFEIWPDSGVINVQGERMRYGSKSETGFRLQEIERGIYGTMPREHTIDLRGISRRTAHGGTGNIRIRNGRLQINTTSDNGYREYVLGRWDHDLYSGLFSQNHWAYGCRMRFRDVNQSGGLAGLALHLGSGQRGYFFELILSDFASKHSNINEFRVYKKDANNNRVGLPTSFQEDEWGNSGIKGYATRVVKGQWFDIDVTRTGTSWSVYLNGNPVFQFTDSEHTGGRYGLFATDHTRVEFDYIYGARVAQGDEAQYHRLLDLIEGGWFSGIGQELHIGDLFMDEFAAVVHEGREFNTDYMTYPATSIDIFNSNVREARVVRQTPNNFKADFTIENADRDPVIVHGESFAVGPDGEDASISHTLEVMGYAMSVRSEEREVYKDESSIRRNGIQEVEISTPWLQTHPQAKEMGRFVTQRWSEPMDVISVDWMPHPGIQVGDVVSVNHPDRGYNASTHQYHVQSITTTNDGALSGQLTLRRVR